MFDASIIISFYNNTKALGLILTALESQKDNFEVIIADDGSNDDAVKYVKDKIVTSPFAIKLVSQKDNGFRKNRILNKAISISSSEYLIFIDGDCIPQTNFVEDHLSNSEKGYLLNGRRVDLPEELGEELYTQANPESFFARNNLKVLALYLTSKGKNIEKGFRIKNKILLAFLNRKDKGIVGCNFSAFKSDLVLVNGFDNTYEAASIGEDTDIEFRMRGVGIKVKNVFYQANILHLMHKELPRTQAVLDIFEVTKKTQQYIALNGLEQAYNEN
ncbi:glycosyltransferase [Vibrio algarum]|uniref:Glycosyltransferase n=1 Tax=Vibrio algarum TaxID=3020714 RepID=A0ABT4YLQ3_9VIBR|nr:glycosyltransferase [Vibrio sp. KJ40-1]MDB1122450.1 glycosyltransferase [Vibrio sp. KJ40-1]